MTTPTFPLEAIARVPPDFWLFVQALPLDASDRQRLYGSLRYLPREPKPREWRNEGATCLST